MKPNAIVTDRFRAAGQEMRNELDPDHKIQRRVYRVLGPSRTPGKIRIETWSHAGKTWSLPHTIEAEKLVPAPEDWPQTKAARKSLQTSDVGRRRL